MANPSTSGMILPLTNPQSQRTNNCLSTPATPYQSPRPMVQPQNHSSIYSSIAESRRQAGWKEDPLYTDEDMKNHSPRGWPSAAATQMYFPNYNSHRAFGMPMHYCLTSLEQKIHCIDEELYRLNSEDALKENKPLKSLPFNREKFIARCAQGVGHLPTQPPEPSKDTLDRMTQKDNLTMVQGILLKEYSNAPSPTPPAASQDQQTPTSIKTCPRSPLQDGGRVRRA
ncbi:hypothetical protein M426DRAFT_258423 [Hypoxylon sp. CI-4A]|nr:hypothetical protein M426DRAFT_258423 [Hypoxylon sp. CI-4A]